MREPREVEAARPPRQAISTWLIGLEAEVELLEHELAKSWTKPLRLAAAGSLAGPLGRGGAEREGPMSARSWRPRPGPTDLDHDARPRRASAGAVDLADRAAASGSGSSQASGSSGAELALEALRSRRPGRGAGRGRDTRRRRDPLVGQQALGGGDELAELDVRRPPARTRRSVRPSSPSVAAGGATRRPAAAAAAASSAAGASGAAAAMTRHAVEASAPTVSGHTRARASSRASRASSRRTAARRVVVG